jgi:hypothetical protein
VAGPIGAATYREEQRGSARDHTAAPAAPASSLGSLGPTEQFLLGFMPRREDFEVEHANEAEGLVASIEHQAGAGKGDAEEDEVETLCKLAQVQIKTNTKTDTTTGGDVQGAAA